MTLSLSKLANSLGKGKSRKWRIILFFVGGALIGSIASEPGDFLYFLRSSNNTPLSPSEQVLYYYMIPAGFYLILLLFAIYASKRHFISPHQFVYLMMGLIIIGGYIAITIPMNQGEAVYPGGIILASAIGVGALYLLRKKLDS